MKALSLLLSLLLIAGVASSGRGQTADVANSATSAAQAVSPKALLSTERVQAPTTIALRDELATGLQSISAEQIGEAIGTSVDSLEKGKTVSYQTQLVSRLSATATEQHTLAVTVHYESRPIGGILSVKLDLLPVFGGIGAASRPAVSREFTQAVEGLDNEAVDQIIANLSHEIASDFEARQPHTLALSHE